MVLHLHKYTDIRKGVREAFSGSIWSEYPEYLSHIPDLDFLESYSTAVKSDQVGRFKWN